MARGASKSIVEERSRDQQHGARAGSGVLETEVRARYFMNEMRCKGLPWTILFIGLSAAFNRELRSLRDAADGGLFSPRGVKQSRILAVMG